ncbi:uncharacterized protein LOC118745632 isoform X2 [Rhagoletis pomonella]|uniref:uncharacterized protein LOC118745632 isoform X2 n=1 Tax=Rhagoletis pomonella TaxID=28610 RepID=UPI001784D0C6|nr:uncharacterized protein LOC118745632 isoform X2 [Rhagoletis pomonella]
MSVRSNNFSTSEVSFLLELVELNKNVLEWKETDRVCAEEKLKVWKEIEIEFNSKFSQVYRSSKVLKTKYENVKKDSKKRLAAERRDIYKTGGGTRASIPSTTIDGKMLSICQPEQIAGNEAIYDDDALEIIEETCLVEVSAEMEENLSASPTENCSSELEQTLDKPQV